ncbi:MAG TPA: hypothetical protein VHB47_25765 [Thermoanaerobaculia bacterium]|jgi:hypothetical protein|nr:hypothetical protein [Thermoanaerobaculia bacterium]
MYRFRILALVGLLGLATLPLHADQNCSTKGVLNPGVNFCLPLFTADTTYSWSLSSTGFVHFTVTLNNSSIVDVRTDFDSGNADGSGSVLVCAEREPNHQTPATNVKICVGP